MKVLILCEDHTKDQYILRPIIQAMLADIGKPRAIVRVCTRPRMRGIRQILNQDNLRLIIRRYDVDLFLLCVDRDGKETRRAALDDRETLAKKDLRPGRHFLAENAWQEIEVWLLAGHELPKKWQWKEIRAERDPKETYYKPFAIQEGVWEERDQGRKTLAEKAASNYSRIRRRCPEDIGQLEKRIKSLF